MLCGGRDSPCPLLISRGLKWVNTYSFLMTNPSHHNSLELIHQCNSHTDNIQSVQIVSVLFSHSQEQCWVRVVLELMLWETRRRWLTIDVTAGVSPENHWSVNPHVSNTVGLWLHFTLIPTKRRYQWMIMCEGVDRTALENTMSSFRDLRNLSCIFQRHVFPETSNMI